MNDPLPDPGAEEPLRKWSGRILLEGACPPMSPAGDETRAAFLHRHGIAPLFGWLGAAQGSAAVEPDTQRAIAVEMARSREFARVIEACAAQLREPPLVYKGQALAHTLYPRPWLRPRGDVDLLVDESAVSSVTGILRTLGYEAAMTTGGDVISPQVTWRKPYAGLVQAWDVHWGISNRAALSGFLTYRDLIASATPVRADGTTFLAPNPVDSLLIACLHLVGHHSGDVRLIWLYDIHLMIQAAPEPSTHAFLDRARSREAVLAACHDALALTADYLPADKTREMQKALETGRRVSTILNRTRLSHLLADFRALPGRRLRFVLQHLFPSTAYMRRRFGLRHGWQVLVWYVIRMARAIPKLFRRT